MDRAAEPQTGEKKPYFHEFTTMTAVLTLLVIYSHSTSQAIAEYDVTTLAYAVVFFTKRLCSVAVPGFIFLSSAKYFARLRSDDELRYGAFLFKRVRRLVPSYVLWVCIYYVYFVGRNYFPFRVADLLKYIADGTLVAHFYFVFVILQFYVLMPLWRRLARLKTAPLVAVTALGFVVMLISQLAFPSFTYRHMVFTSYVFFWLLGILCGTRFDALKTLLRSRRTVPLVAFVVFTAHFVLSYLKSRGMLACASERALHFVCVTALLTFLVYFAVKIPPERIPLWRLCKAVADASFYIYLSHILMIFIVEQHTADLGLTQSTLLRLVLALTVPTALSIAYTTLSKKIRGRQKSA